MKRFVAFTIVLLFAFAAGYASAADDITQVPSCKYCGMDRGKYNHSRMYIEYDQGKPEGFCSVHCAAVDLSVNIDKKPMKILVADYTTKDLMDAEKAFWVIGGKKPGVMTRRGKWAFRTEEDANAFIKESGGSPASFDTVMSATYEDMYQDSKMIRQKRAMRRQSMQHDHGKTADNAK